MSRPWATQHSEQVHLRTSRGIFGMVKSQQRQPASAIAFDIFRLRVIFFTLRDPKRTTLAVTSIDTGSNSHRQETKYLPAASLVMAKVHGSSECPVATCSLPCTLTVTVYKRARSGLSRLLVPFVFEGWMGGASGEEVSKTVCGWRRGCWMGTQKTSLSQTNSGNFFCAVRRAFACR